MTVAVLLAGALAGLLSFIELANSRRRTPSRNAVPVVLIRCLIDATSGLLAFPIVKATLGDISWFSYSWLVIVTGFCGPAFLRSQLALVGSGQEQANLGPARVYERLRKYLEDQIDDIDSVAQTKWTTKACEKLSGLSATELEQRSCRYVDGLRALEHVEKQSLSDFLHKTACDPTTSQEDKRRAIIEKLVQSRGRRFVRSLF